MQRVPANGCPGGWSPIFEDRDRGDFFRGRVAVWFLFLFGEGAGLVARTRKCSSAAGLWVTMVFFVLHRSEPAPCLGAVSKKGEGAYAQ